MGPDIRLDSIRVQRIDLALTRPLKMSIGEIRRQNVLLVRLSDGEGTEGVGEAVVMGGPHYSHDTIEGVEAVVTRYAAPHLMGRTFAADLGAFSTALGPLFRGNGPARSALEMAFLDLLGKRSGRSAADLLGGARTRTVPVAWTIPSGDLAGAIADGERAIQQRGHRTFKMKVGIAPIAAEARYASEIVRRFGPGVRLIVDANQAWSETQAMDAVRQMSDAGVAAVEQPMNGSDVAAMSRLQATFRDVTLIADEGLSDPAMAHLYATQQGARCFAVKPQRDGGLALARAAARRAVEAGLTCYGGTMLETSIGTAAFCALYSTLPDLSWGTELFGPLRLEEDLIANPPSLVGGDWVVPQGPGLGVQLDEDKISFLAKRTLQPV